MGVVRTDNWLLRSYDKPLTLCSYLKEYFDGVTTFNIYTHLTNYGMYRYPQKNKQKIVQSLQEKEVWELVALEQAKLSKRWSGPDVPIFIFPADTQQRIQTETGDKSGLAFSDKLFLFISAHNSEEEIKAVLTHEYNHICRLDQYTKSESDYSLLDTIILEGLAENAVHQIVGESWTSPWVHYYSNTELQDMWETIVYPNRNITTSHRLFHRILYGLGLYPKMTGYAVGYYLVKNYMNTKELTDETLLTIPSNVIAESNSKNEN